MNGKAKVKLILVLSGMHCIQYIVITLEPRYDVHRQSVDSVITRAKFVESTFFDSRNNENFEQS